MLLEKCQESKIPYITPLSCEKTYVITLREVNLNHKKLWILSQLSLGFWGPVIRIKLTISGEFGSPQAKLWYHKFSSMTAFWHCSHKTSCHKFSALIPGNPTPSWLCSVVLDFIVFLVKYYTSLIYVKAIHFVQLIQYFFLWVSWDPFHAATLQKYFRQIRVEVSVS